VHTPHVIVAPQLSTPVPQVAPLVQVLFDVQPQMPAVPPPPQVCGAVQVPQVTVLPQLSAPVPQVLPLAHLPFDVQPH
jgi:hypothetical protein